LGCSLPRKPHHGLATLAAHARFAPNAATHPILPDARGATMTTTELHTDTTHEADAFERAVESDAGPSASDRQMATAAHLIALLAALVTSWFAGIAGVFGALIVWFLVRDRSAFAAEHAREAINFNLSMFIYAVATVVLLVFTLGLGIVIAAPLWVVLGLMWIVCTIIAAFRAYDDRSYRYPLTLRLV
jgi:hypothetical protein